MKKTIMIFIMLFSVSCFALTLTFKGELKSVPTALQGNWTEVAVSQNKGDTWVDGISVPLKITKNTIKIGDTQWIVTSVKKYIDDSGYTGYLFKLAEVDTAMEFWFEDDNTVILLLHEDRVELARCHLIRR